MEIVPREDWAHKSPNRFARLVPKAKRKGWVVHWPGAPGVDNIEPTWDAEVKALRSALDWHLKKNWADIGYNVAIGPSGRVYECRGLERQGAHAEGYNVSYRGVVLLVGLKDEPTKEMLDSFAELRKTYGEGEIILHGDLSGSECPGPYLRRAHLQGWLGAESVFENHYVAAIQDELVDRGHNLGNYGPYKNGVDGKLGELTSDAIWAEMGE